MEIHIDIRDIDNVYFEIMEQNISERVDLFVSWSCNYYPVYLHDIISRFTAHLIDTINMCALYVNHKLRLADLVSVNCTPK